MSYKDWLIDKRIYLLIQVISISFITILLELLSVNKNGIIFILFIMIGSNILYLCYDYFRRYSFYKEIDKHLSNLDKKFFISELILEPNFYEGVFIHDVLKVITKSMNDEIAKFKLDGLEYKDYIETWVHEIKTPLSASKLLIGNNKNEITLSIDEELEKVDKYVEQALYYARSSHVEKDYIIRSIELKSIATETIKSYSKQLIANKCDIDIRDLTGTVYTDKKWMSFILGQIISNSIKYRSGKMKLKIYSEEKKDNVILYIEDNGIGILESDIENVFEKGYTGKNGREVLKSTGIGLYLCKKLCTKMGLDICIYSKVNQMTTVSISFPKSNMYS